MELAIPLVVLGGLYISSNDKKAQTEKVVAKEGYVNMGKPANYLPNMDIPCSNYPVAVKDDCLGPDDVNEYPNGRSSLDQYYNETIYERESNKGVRVGSDIQEIYSLTGEPIDIKNFKHNNMVPFFGAKLRGTTSDADSNQSRLDNMQGNGSQYFKKVEQAPLFSPQESLQFPYGAPNNSDFYQSRVNPGARMANVKPWEEQKVAPGLNQGYGTSGSNGFNSGMESRDSWLPRTVNELRTANNPKVTFGLENHQGPASAEVKNMGILGAVEKNRPDTAYEWGPSRYFTTTGVEQAPRPRGVEVMQPVNRTETTTSYYGSAANEGYAGYTQGKHEAPKRTQLGPAGLAAASAPGAGGATTGDYGIQGFKTLPNNRSTTTTSMIGNVGGLVKAAMAPVMDVLRPSRKENAIGNARPNGNVAVTIASAPVHNPAERTKTTNREMTGDKLDCNHLNVQNQKDGAYSVSKHTPVSNQRDTTSVHYIGGTSGGATQTGARGYNAEYNQRNNVNKTYKNRPNMGGMQIFNQFTNVSIAKRDSDRENNRWGVASGGVAAIPSKDTYGLIHGGSMTLQEDSRNMLERINPDILNAFKDNPYTKPLDSWA